jgi:hypothetical protein
MLKTTLKRWLCNGDAAKQLKQGMNYLDRCRQQTCHLLQHRQQPGNPCRSLEQEARCNHLHPDPCCKPQNVVQKEYFEPMAASKALTRCSQLTCEVVSPCRKCYHSSTGFVESTVDSPEIGHPPDPGKPVALKACSTSGPHAIDVRPRQSLQNPSL